MSWLREREEGEKEKINIEKLSMTIDFSFSKQQI